VSRKQLLQSSENQEEEGGDDLRGRHQVRQDGGSCKEVRLREGKVFNVSSVELQEPDHWIIQNPRFEIQNPRFEIQNPNYTKNHLF